MTTEFAEHTGPDLSEQQIARIVEGVAGSLRSQMPPTTSRRTRNSPLAIVSTCVAICALAAALIGSLITMSNRQATQQTDLLNINRRVEILEQSSASGPATIVQIADLKQAFSDFRDSYRQDFRDLKLQVQSQTDDAHKRPR